MQKIIIDTNVLVSALIQRNFPYYILNEIFANQDIELCISEDLFQEYYEVLNRKKFAKFTDFVSNAQFILTEIERVSKKYTPRTTIDIISDKDDNKLLELARESRADYLITGNHTDFTMTEFEGTQILTPKEYWLDHLMKK